MKGRKRPPSSFASPLNPLSPFWLKFNYKCERLRCRTDHLFHNTRARARASSRPFLLAKVLWLGLELNFLSDLFYSCTLSASRLFLSPRGSSSSYTISERAVGATSEKNFRQSNYQNERNSSISKKSNFVYLCARGGVWVSELAGRAPIL